MYSLENTSQGKFLFNVGDKVCCPSSYKDRVFTITECKTDILGHPLYTIQGEDSYSINVFETELILMEEHLRYILYGHRKYLNPQDSPSTGDIVCYDGYTRDFGGESARNTYLSISDCRIKIRIMKESYETMEEYIEMLNLINSEITNFLEYLTESKK